MMCCNDHQQSHTTSSKKEVCQSVAPTTRAPRRTFSMMALCVLTLYLITGMAKAINVTAYVGGAVYVKCEYGGSGLGKDKQVCKWQDAKRMELIRTRDARVKEGRFFLKDNGTGYFEVGLAQLTTQDAGQYECVTDPASNATTRINLEVREDACCGKKVQLEAPAGEDVNISCPYLDAHAQGTKFFCKTFGMHDCRYLKVVQSDRIWEPILRDFSVYDDREAKVLTVTVKNFRKVLAGSFRCGVEMSWDSNGYKVVFNHVQLTLKARQPKPTPSPTPSPSPTPTTTPPPSTSSSAKQPKPTPSPTPTATPPPSTSSSDLVRVIDKKCKQSDVECKLDFLNELEQNSSVSTLLPKEVSSLLDSLLEAPRESLASRGEDVLQSTEKLVSRLVEPTHTQSRRNLSTNTTKVEVLSVGLATTLKGVSQLDTANVRLDIDLLGIAGNNNGSASVVLMVYKSMREVLNASFFSTGPSETAHMMSNVISVILPNTLNKTLLIPVNLTIQHLKPTHPTEKPSCVYWNVSAWIEDGCHVSETNPTHTVCSCDHLSTFALIMTVDHTQESDPILDILNTILVLIGLVFLTLAVMTFALCRWNPRVSNVSRLNLCVCLLLAHPLFLLTQSFHHLIWPHEVLCKLLAGVLHFLFLCCFMWMSIEAALLFLSVRKLRQVKPNERAGLHWKLSVLIGYGIPLVIVSVSAGVRPDGYGSEECWLKTENGFNWSFLGLVCFIIVANIILFLTIIITIHSTLKEARSDVSKVKYNRVLLFKIMMQFVILGCTWILGLLASHSRVLEVLFLFLTSQQGTAIFVIHCLLNIEVWRQYRVWWQRFRPSGKQTDSSAGTSISLTQQPSGATLSTSHSVLSPGPQHSTVSWDKTD
ncbi:adhesion G protein-coupled receptor E3-like isoform X2 [Alosa sapidissima]|uniref:adhesion G protein-coupled receptor E3-like isoform X2 n=1 Tax=Alosa sapidissima TaxID=34773 RepID=UPI001C0A456E|nr:adhesion G protein-coupled receptor E3-like isoform X2 [Alosa sapidissima]